MQFRDKKSYIFLQFALRQSYACDGLRRKARYRPKWQNRPLRSCLRLALKAITLSPTGADTCVSFFYQSFQYVNDQFSLLF